MPMHHQFMIGISGYTAFPRIGDPTPVRLLPKPAVPSYRYVKRTVFPTWAFKAQLVAAAAATVAPPKVTAQQLHDFMMSRGRLPSYQEAKKALTDINRDFAERQLARKSTMHERNPCSCYIYNLSNGVVVIDPPQDYEYTFAVKRTGLTMSDYAATKLHEKQTGNNQGRWVDGTFYEGAPAGPPIQKIGNDRRIPSEGELKVTSPWPALREERPRTTGNRGTIGCVDDPFSDCLVNVGKRWGG